MDSLARTRDLYHRGQIDSALSAVRDLCAQEPQNAEAWWMLGCIARHAGMTAISDGGFRRASELLPKQMPMPYRVPTEHFHELVGEARGILDDSAAVNPSTPETWTRDEARKMLEEAAAVPSAGFRRWGILVPGQAAAARLETDVTLLPSRDAIRAGVSPDARWSSQGRRVLLYQTNLENAAGCDRDLIVVILHCLVAASRTSA